QKPGREVAIHRAAVLEYKTGLNDRPRLKQLIATALRHTPGRFFLPVGRQSARTGTDLSSSASPDWLAPIIAGRRRWHQRTRSFNSATRGKGARSAAKGRRFRMLSAE